MIEELVTSTLILVLGYAYPALQCFKAVEQNRIDIHELRFWCQYWIIVALVTILERIGDVFISWLPMYGEMKLALFIFLWYPKTQGTGYVYNRLLRPYVYKHGTDIDSSMVEFRERAWKLAIYYWNNCTELGSTKILEFLQFVSSETSSITQPNTSESANHVLDQSIRPSTYSGVFNRNNSNPPLRHNAACSYRNQAPKSESIQVQLHNQTHLIRPEDVLLPDSNLDGLLDEKSSIQEGQVQALRHRLRRFIGGK